MSKLIDGILSIKSKNLRKSSMRVLYVDLLDGLDMLYHFDDDPTDIVRIHTNEPLFSPEECVAVKEMTNLLHSDELFSLSLERVK